MSRQFVSTTKYRPCPICEGTQGDCRLTDRGNILCHACVLGDGAREFKWVKSIQDIWGLHVPAIRYHSGSNFLKTTYQKAAQEPSKDEKRQLKHALGTESFDRAYRACCRSSGLDESHRHNLRDRGLTDEEIERHAFFSIAPNQDVGAAVPWAFPGVKDARRFSVSSTGFTVPLFDRQGWIHGYQVRLDRVEKSKYRWAKGELSSHLAVDGTLELPLSFLKGTSQNSKRIGLVEGGLKAILTVKRLGLDTIGAAGGLFANSPKQFHQLLTGKTEALIFPDGGDVLKAAVMCRWVKQVKFLEQRGILVKIAWWGQFEKNDGDIDEIPQETSARIAYLSPKAFYQIARQVQSPNSRLQPTRV